MATQQEILSGLADIVNEVAGVPVADVQLDKSSIILIDGKEVTEFTLTAFYQTPDPSAIKTVPVSLAVR